MGAIIGIIATIFLLFFATRAGIFFPVLAAVGTLAYCANAYWHIHPVFCIVIFLVLSSVLCFIVFRNTYVRVIGIVVSSMILDYWIFNAVLAGSDTVWASAAVFVFSAVILIYILWVETGGGMEEIREFWT